MVNQHDEEVLVELKRAWKLRPDLKHRHIATATTAHPLKCGYLLVLTKEVPHVTSNSHCKEESLQ